MPNCKKKMFNKKIKRAENSKKSMYYYLPALLIFVSLTSFLVGTRIGSDSGIRTGMMLDTIILSPGEETVDENRIDFSGQVWNADGTPCANQLLELHSDPIRTQTDSEGLFYFRDVEIGEHQLLLLDDQGQTQAQIALEIQRDKQVVSGKLVRESAASYHLDVSEQAIVLSIQVQLDGQNQIVLDPEIYTRKPGEGFRDSQGNEHSYGQFQPGENQANIPESGEGKLDQENIQGDPTESGTSAEIKDTNETFSGTRSTGESQSGAVSQPTGGSESPTELAQSKETELESSGGLLPSSGTAASGETETAGPTSGNTGGGGSGNGGSGGNGGSHTKPTRPTPTEPTAPSESETGTVSPTKPTETDPTKPTETDPTKPTETNPTKPTETDPTKPTETDPTKPTETDPSDTATDPGTVPVVVQEKGGPVWTQNTVISLFANRTGVGAEQKLIPGSKGYYEFLISNPNTFSITYRMNITAPQGQLLLPLRYRLKSEGTYLCGDKDNWLTADQLSAESVKLTPDTAREYTLEWQWLYEGGDDAYDTQIGTAKNLEYRVIVTVVIEQTTV